MAIKTMDDIDREKHKEGREKMKAEVTEDVNDILGNIFGRPKARRRKTFLGYFLGVLKWLGIIFLLLVVINFILGNIWLLRFFIKSLFGIG